MTTIAYRDGVLAADTAIFDRDCYCGQANKIFRSLDGAIGAVAGCMGDSAAFSNWFTTSMMVTSPEPPELKDENSEGIIILNDGRVLWVGHGKKIYPMTADYFAIGSGFRIAMGALHAGASAEDAVKVAADLDAHTRAPISIMVLGEK